MQIKSAKYLISSPSFDVCPSANKPEFAFIGRSNVGKSSLINMLVNQKNLAKTSGTPGKTQLINHFEIVSKTKEKKENDNWYLVDLPGYGYAKVALNNRRRWQQMIENYLRKRENIVNIFVLIDARHKPQKIDLEFVNQLGEWQIPFTLVFTKADKEKLIVVERNAKAFLTELKENWEFLPQSFITSAEKGVGKDDVLNFIEQCLHK
jgi:GTP-binding protein